MSIEGTFVAMKVVVSGASGCVGHALVPQLLAADHEVIVLSRADVPAALASGASTIAADLSRPLPRHQLPARIDGVVHLAQGRRYRNFPAAADEIFAVNVAASVDLARYALDAGARAYAYASSGSVYVPAREPLSEDAATAPSNFYTASKLAAEALLQPFARHLDVSLLRLFYVYGPRQSGMLADGLAARIVSDTAISLDGPSGITLAPAFSSDVAAVILRAVTQGWSGVCNVGAQTRIDLKSYAESIGRALGKAPKFEIRSEVAPATVLPDLTKLRECCGALHETPLAEGLALTFANGRNAT